jgi:c-di-GMP-binding flagellar brake protein YcgR
MSKELPLTIEKFHDGEESKFLIRSPKEIQLTLNAIVQKKSATILYFDNEQRFLKTLLLGVTENGIWLDVGPNEEDNIHLLDSDSITFVTKHQGAKVQFVCHQPLIATYASHPAFYFPLPDHILRLQRRDYFRLSTSPDAPLKCIIPTLAMKSEKHDEITIMDISVGGIALICKEHNVKLGAGEIYPDCRIELPGIGTLIATIQVRNLFDVSSPSGEISKHAGCEFVQMDGKMCMLLQRYVGIMQSKLSKSH